MKAHKLSKLTVKEYIQHENETGQKYEYQDGFRIRDHISDAMVYSITPASYAKGTHPSSRK